MTLDKNWFSEPHEPAGSAISFRITKKLAEAVAEHVGEAHEQRHAQALALRELDDLGQRDRRPVRAARADDDAPLPVDVDIPLAPVRDRVGVQGLFDGPVGHSCRVRNLA